MMKKINWNVVRAIVKRDLRMYFQQPHGLRLHHPLHLPERRRGYSGRTGSSSITSRTWTP
jgi:hypothetical protein